MVLATKYDACALSLFQSITDSQAEKPTNIKDPDELNVKSQPSSGQEYFNKFVATCCLCCGLCGSRCLCCYQNNDGETTTLLKEKNGTVKEQCSYLGSYSVYFFTHTK